MKNLKHILTILFCTTLCMLVVSSCGKKEEPEEPLYIPDLSVPDKSDFIGAMGGTVSITKPGVENPTIFSNGGIRFSKTLNDDILFLELSVPNITAGITTKNFRKSSEQNTEYYFFDIEPIEDLSFNENEVTQQLSYIKDWFTTQSFVIENVVFKKLEFSDIKYSLASKELSFIITCQVDVKSKAGETISSVIVYTYSNMKKIP